MKMKLIGTAVTAALLALSTASFAQSSGSDSSGSDSAARKPGTTAEPVSGRDSGAAVGTSRDAGVSTMHCDTLSGAEKTRCMRDARASTGSSNTGSTGSNMGSTDGKRQVPGDSGNKLGGKDSGGK